MSTIQIDRVVPEPTYTIRGLTQRDIDILAALVGATDDSVPDRLYTELNRYHDKDLMVSASRVGCNAVLTVTE